MHRRRLLRRAVPDMLKARMMLHGLLHAHHGMVWLRCATLIALCALAIIIVVISTVFVREVGRALVFVRAAIVLEAADYLVDV